MRNALRPACGERVAGEGRRMRRAVRVAASSGALAPNPSPGNGERDYEEQP